MIHHEYQLQPQCAMTFAPRSPFRGTGLGDCARRTGSERRRAAVHACIKTGPELADSKDSSPSVVYTQRNNQEYWLECTGWRNGLRVRASRSRWRAEDKFMGVYAFTVLRHSRAACSRLIRPPIAPLRLIQPLFPLEHIKFSGRRLHTPTDLHVQQAAFSAELRRRALRR